MSNGQKRRKLCEEEGSELQDQTSDPIQEEVMIAETDKQDQTSDPIQGEVVQGSSLSNVPESSSPEQFGFPMTRPVSPEPQNWNPGPSLSPGPSSSPGIPFSPEPGSSPEPTDWIHGPSSFPAIETHQTSLEPQDCSFQDLDSPSDLQDNSIPALPSTSEEVMESEMEYYESEFARPPSPDFIPFNHGVNAQNANEDDFKWEEEYEENETDSEGSMESVFVYKGSTLTVHESCVAILTCALSFSLSGRCIEALLRLINIHCLEEENKMKKSLYLFKKYFSQIRGSVDYEYFCSKCMAKCPEKKCPTCEGNPKMCCLIKLPLLEQLEIMLQREDFRDSLKARPDLQDLLKDVYDGKVYQEALKDHGLGLLFALSFMWYTDGASVFESSQISVWPLFLTINELPYNKRFLKENVLVPCLWCGPVKPHGNFMINAIYPELTKLSKGVSLKVNGQDTVVTGMVLHGTGDTPARAVMLNMIAHNGEHSCQRCYQKGEPRAGCFGVRVFPYRPKEMTPRLEKNMVREGGLASLLGRPYLGWKGTTALYHISPTPLRGTAVDPMHLIYGGLGKMLVKFLVGEEHSNMDYNVHKTHSSLISERLQKIKPPYYMTRLPQTISRHSTWKTSEHKSWFLYYCLPILKDLIADINFRHLSSIVAAVQLLNSEAVSKADMKTAGALIVKFVEYFEDLYGREYMTLTVHLFLHLIELVEDIGPLWTFACFALEGLNGIIMHLVHGTSYPEKQIATSLKMCMGLPEMIRNLPQSPAKSFCEDLVNRSKKGKKTKIQNFYAIGKIEDAPQVPSYLEEQIKLLKLGDRVQTFNSLRKDTVLYVAEKLSGSTDSSCVKYTQDGKLCVGIIKTFFKAPCCCEKDCVCEVYCLLNCLDVVSAFPTLLPDVFVPNIHEFVISDRFVAVTAGKLYDVCVRMDVNSLYIASRCNRYEKE